MRSRILLLLAGLLFANVLAWAWAFSRFSASPALLGFTLLAWGFGLRHAVDADHIAAIDNVTRRMMQQGRRPVGIGLFFSLGHSAVVALCCLLIIAAHAWFDRHAVILAGWGGMVGTSVSAGFLLLIGGANLLLLFALLRGGGGHSHDRATPHGLLSRLWFPLMQRVGSARGLLGLGFLFGLGFDTATEIGVLALAATSAGGNGASGIDWSAMCFPALFAAGMSLVDTLDGMLMMGAYSWALDAPLRRRRYNIAITAGSVFVAFAIGAMELAELLPGILPDRFDVLGDHSGLLGASVIAGFVLLWLSAIACAGCAERRHADDLHGHDLKKS